jgi:hypothetical protein
MRFSLRGARKMTNRVHLNPLWAVAEPNTPESPFWSDLPVIYQGADLKVLFAELRKTNEAVIFITPHSPLLRPSMLVEAAEKLSNQTNEIVGRSKTGGVYLWGARELAPNASGTNNQTATKLDQLVSTSAKEEMSQIFVFERPDDLTQLGDLLATADGEWARALKEQLGPFV